MNTNVMNANDSLKNYHGGETIFKNPTTGIQYTEGVRTITMQTESYWFLDLIASYQRKLKIEDFQVWKLKREYSYTTNNGVKSVLQRKNCFNVVCEDGNDNVLITQNIPFSDFPFDEYVVWLQNEIIYLPCEH